MQNIKCPLNLVHSGGIPGIFLLYPSILILNVKNIFSHVLNPNGKCKNTYSGHTIQAYINILPGCEKYKIRFFFF